MFSEVISCRGIEKSFGACPVLSNLSLAAGPGEVLLVVGPNGVGKSTLLKLLGGALVPDKGEVVNAAGPEKTAYMGHKTFLYPRLTAVQNLEFWASLYGGRPDEHELLDLLGQVGLLRAAHERCSGFSRGMAQRLSLARVLYIDPLLFLLDEPGTGLDPWSKRLLGERIAAAAARGGTVIWVSHDLERDTALATRVLHLAGPGRASLSSAGSFTAGEAGIE